MTYPSMSIRAPVAVRPTVRQSFVHAGSRAEQPTADDRNAGQLQQSLDSAALAVFTVQDRECRIQGDGLYAAVFPETDAVDCPVRGEPGRSAGLI